MLRKRGTLEEMWPMELDDDTELLREIWLQLVAINKSLNTKIDQLDTSLTTRIDQTNMRLDETNARLAQMSATLTAFQTQTHENFARVQRNFERVEGRFERMDGRLERLELGPTHLHDLDARLTRVEEHVGLRER